MDKSDYQQGIIYGITYMSEFDINLEDEFIVLIELKQEKIILILKDNGTMINIVRITAKLHHVIG